MTSWYERVVLPRLLNSEMGSKELESIRREVLAEASRITLEIGVGPGHNLPLYKKISKLYALEPSKELIDLAKARAASLSFPVEFLNVGAEDIPLADRSIDTVVSTWTLCSVTDPRRVLREIARVLRKSGRFIFAEHGASPNSCIHTAQKAYTFVTKRFTGNCHYDRPIGKLIEGAGLHIQKMERLPERFRPLIYNYQGIAIRA